MIHWFGQSYSDVQSFRLNSIRFNLAMAEEQKTIPLRRRNKLVTEKKTDDGEQVKSKEDEKSELK